MTTLYVLRVKAFATGTPYAYLCEVSKDGLKAVFSKDIEEAIKFDWLAVVAHKEQYAHISGRFVILDYELKRIAQAKETV